MVVMVVALAVSLADVLHGPPEKIESCMLLCLVLFMFGSGNSAVPTMCDTQLSCIWVAACHQTELCHSW